MYKMALCEAVMEGANAKPLEPVSTSSSFFFGTNEKALSPV
jgi:hypothetical protein